MKNETQKLYENRGARIKEHGVSFAVWAPNAKTASAIVEGKEYPLKLSAEEGVWKGFVKGIRQGAHYFFQFETQSGEILQKNDPFALYFQQRPCTSAVVSTTNNFTWTDQSWLAKRSSTDWQNAPINIYEVHLGSWKKYPGVFPGYVALAEGLIEYCHRMSYTHVELLPICEHPLDESWGYQVTGYFAVTSRYGTIEDFQHFVNALHNAGIGVLLDWVPAHFPTDSHALGNFDGTPLFEEHELHPDWSTHVFDFGRKEVADFLISSALYWLDEMHIDGLRVDAVSTMLYLDYEEGGLTTDPNAIAFFQKLNSTVHEIVPGALMIAEEATAYPGVTKPDGLGFDFKWNMGWMNDTLSFMQKSDDERALSHKDLTFGITYAFQEKYILPLSHDEVVHEKRSLFSKMPGDESANLRLLLSYMICHSGKILLFMGGEIGQKNEWDCKGYLDWENADEALQNFNIDLGALYLGTPALYENDNTLAGFQWHDFSDTTNSVISYFRIGYNSKVLCIHNFQNKCQTNSLLGNFGHRLLFNSDAKVYGGSGVDPFKFLPPLSTLIFEITDDD